jgi:cell division protein FtsI (penicillin-binding protein 3)
MSNNSFDNGEGGGEREPYARVFSSRQPSSSQSSGRQSSGRQPSGRQPSSRQAANRQPSGRQSSNRQPSERQPSGRQPASRQPSGYQPSGTGQSLHYQERKYNTLVMFVLFVCFSVFILARLIYIQVYAASDLSQIAQAQRQPLDPQPIEARRGSIYDRNGMILATTVDTVSVYANTLQMQNPEATAYYVAQIVGGEPEEWLEKFLNAPEEASNVLIIRQGDLDIAAAFDEQNAKLEKAALQVERLGSKLYQGGAVWIVETALSCINYDYEYMRVYPYAAIAAQVVGTINNEGVAICGLELQYDAILKGRDGQISVERGRDGTPLPNGRRTEIPKHDGEDIIISIDIGLQEYVESELARYGALGRTNEGSITIVDGSTGEIYAAASLPLYNRHEVTTEEIELGAMSLKGIVVPYEPGSTMKGVTAAAALEGGVVSTSDVFWVPNRMTIDGYTIKDWYPRYDEYMDLRHILAQSSNIGMTMVAQQLGNRAMFDFFYQAGFYQPAHVDYVGLSGIGEPTYLTDAVDPITGAYLSIADKPELWSSIHAANLSFGQGLYVTALQMAVYYGALATGGERTDPHFLIDRPQGSGLQNYRTIRIMSPETADTMTDLLESVLTEGTGTYAAVPGYRIAGKTGTAEVASARGGYSDQVVQSMVGYFADSDCNLVCMVTMQDSGLVGNAVAPKPLFASAMEYIANRYWVEPNGSGRDGM